jgi:hypothetical protein
MSESKPVVWFADERKPNDFFFRSPFRSWKFIFNTTLVAVVTLALAAILWDYRDKLNQKPVIWLVLLALFPQNVVFPLFRALRRRKKINELYTAGYIAKQSAGSPLDEVLEVTDSAVNESLGNALFLFGVFLFFTVLWKLG